LGVGAPLRLENRCGEAATPQEIRMSPSLDPLRPGAIGSPGDFVSGLGSRRTGMTVNRKRCRSPLILLLLVAGFFSQNLTRNLLENNPVFLVLFSSFLCPFFPDPFGVLKSPAQIHRKMKKEKAKMLRFFEFG
jgi:hypothetical protein